MTTDGDLRAIFARRILDAHWQSIETGGTGRGIPDSNYCLNSGEEGWVEFKKTTGWALSIQAEQIAWIERRARVGGRVFVAVRRKTAGGPRAGKAVDQLWLLGPEAARLRTVGPVLSAGLVRGCWDGGPARWNWLEIRHLLSRK